MQRLLICLVAIVASAAHAETIAVIGTGNVAKALGPEFAQQGHTIIYGSRNPDRGSVRKLVDDTPGNASAAAPADAVVDADIVVLAVPGMLVEEITLGLGDLSGKIIIDPTNPLDRKMLKFYHGRETSNTEIIQRAAPDADVVKAFNTLNWQYMVDPDSAGGPVSVPLAGDSGRAKKVVAELVENMGLEPIDVGGAERAGWLEGMAVLLVSNMMSTRPSFNFHLRPVP